MSHNPRLLLCTLLLGAVIAGPAAADALATLTDAALLKKAQQEIGQMAKPDLDALTDTITTCSSVTLGQRPQTFECLRTVNRYWAQHNRGRSIDAYVAALSGLFAAFDNNPLNPTDEMQVAYKHATVDMVALTKTINQRYQQLDK